MKAYIAAVLAAAVALSVTAAPLRMPLSHHPRTRSLLVDDPLLPNAKKRYFLPHAFKPSLAPNVARCTDTSDACGGSSASVPLDGSIAFGEYYIGLTVGASNKRPFLVQVDSGSSDFAVISSKVSGYPTLPHYDPWTSSTAHAVSCDALSHCVCVSGQCTYAISYLDGSGFTANMYNDTIVAAGTGLKYIGYVGAVVKQTKGFDPPPVAGIVGVAYQTVSEVDAPTLIDSVVDQVAGAEDMFSMCMNSGAKDGVMTVGGAPDLSYSYTPIIKESFYVVYVESMSVNGEQQPVDPSAFNQNMAVVDSGTTDLLIPQAAYEAVSKTLEGMCGKTNLVGICDATAGKTLLDGYCFEMTDAEIAEYPPLSFTFKGGAVIDIPSTQYLSLDQSASNGAKYYCSGIINGGTSDPTIFGDVAMRGYTVLFDRANTRMGFAKRQAGVPCE